MPRTWLVPLLYILFFFIDLCLYSIFEHQLLTPLLCYYATTLINPLNPLIFTGGIILLGLLSLVTTGWFGLTMTLIMVLSCISLQLKKRISITLSIPLIFYLGYWFSTHLVMPHQSLFPYTFTSFFANILLIIILTYFEWR